MRARIIQQAPVTIPESATTANGAAVATDAGLPFRDNYTLVALLHLAAAANGTIRIQTSQLDSGDTDWTTVASHAVTTAWTGQLPMEFVAGRRMRVQVLGSASGAGTVALGGLLGN